MILLTCLGILLQGERLHDCNLQSVRLAKATPLLSQLAGQPVEISPNLAGDILILRVKSAPASKILARVSRAVNATWIQKPGKLVLEQTPAQLQEDQKAIDAYRMEVVNQALIRAKAESKKYGRFDEQAAQSLRKDIESFGRALGGGNRNVVPTNLWEQMERLDARSPAARFGARVTQLLTSAMLNQVTEANPRVVFSTRPTAMQLPIPIRLNEAIREYVAEQAVWAQTLDGKPLRGQQTDQGNRRYLGSAANDYEPIKKPVEIVQIVVHYLDYAEMLSVDVTLYDAEGMEIGGSSFSSEPIQAEPENPPISPVQKKKIQFSPAAQRYIDILSHPEKKVLPHPDLLKILIQPEQREPDAESTFEILADFVSDDNFVAVNVTDLAEQISDSDREFKSKFAVEKDLKWTTITPRMRKSHRKSIVVPHVLGPLVRRAATLDCSTIEEQADFEFKLPENWQASQTYRTRADWVRLVEIPNNSDQKGLRIYGSLDPNAQKALLRGQKIPVSRLSAATKRELFKAIFAETYVGWEVDSESVDDSDPKQVKAIATQVKAIASLEVLINQGILSEPTSMCPSGITGDMILSAVESSQDALLPAALQGAEYGYAQTRSAQELGNEIFQSARPEKYPWVSEMSNRFDENQIRLVRTRSLTLTIKVTKFVNLSFYLDQTQLKDNRVYTLATLPESIRKEIEAGYKVAEAVDKNVPVRRPVRTPPPQS